MTAPESSLQKFKALLGEMLQTEKSDLDFGIYRVVGQRRREMDDFISQTIPNALKEAVAAAQPQNAALAEKEALEQKIRQDYGDNAFTPEGELKPEFAGGGLGKQWREVRERAGDARPLTREDVCNRLLQFFARYYAEGDFVSKRRYAGQNEKYAVPYDGREVMLHWANRDQYYVKTADRFAQYAFQVKGGAFQFRVEKTPAQKDNNKPPKGDFILADAREEGGRVVALFHRRELSEKEKAEISRANLKGDRQTKILALAEANIKGAFPALAPLLEKHSAQKEKSLFAVHAARFVRRNTSDYFIHRNLRAFLRRELDFFLKNEAINADELAESADAQNRLAAFRAVRGVARQVIDMLAQWENFQKSLWEKKKFVLQTEYCVALGKIPQWKTCGILECVADCEKQWAEWKALGMQGDSPDLFDNGKNRREKRLNFLRKHPSLPVDTKNFTPEPDSEPGFKERLLAQFPDIDDATDGVLIHGDNWQALNLLQETCRGRVKCVYIDPPYNTGGDGFLYRDQYQHSSWLSMVSSRFSLVRGFIPQNGVVFVSIDDKEVHLLRTMMGMEFGEDNFVALLPTVMNLKGNQDEFGFAGTHEYTMVFAQDRENLLLGEFEVIDEGLTEWEEDEWGPFKKGAILKGTGVNATREKRPNLHFPLYIGERDGCLVARVERNSDSDVEIYPTTDGAEMTWRWERKKFIREPHNVIVERANGNGYAIFKKQRPGLNDLPSRKPKTLFYKPEYSSGNGTQQLRDLFGVNRIYANPKPLELVADFIEIGGMHGGVVLDYFAGSGTTAHAVINLNREDGGRRKFILAEMGDYFHTVLLPRVKKIIYAPEWLDGKPSRPATAEEFARGPSLVKYHRIESYEDALDNVEFKGEAGLRGLSDFIPRYMLRWESRENPTFLSDEGLENPFAYGLVLSGENARTERADLPETFSYLIGLRVRTREDLTDAGTGRRYVVLRGESGGEETAVVWRDVSGWVRGDWEADRDFIAGRKFGGRLWVNANSLVDGAKVLDLEFRRRMFPLSDDGEGSE